jgi:nucleoside-diphosphate-sugar epimerase
MKQTMVVTGAGGFIGYHLANALASDRQHVVGVDLRFPDKGGVLGAPRFSPVVGDFRDRRVMKEALTGASVLFHVASAHLQVSAPDAVYWDVNVHSLPGLLEVAREAGVARCVHTSSVAVYGDVGPMPADEATPPRPQSIYGETKLAGEKTVLASGRANGIEVVVLRPAWVYGAGCPRTAKLCRSLRDRRFVMVGQGNNFRHPLYIADMITAFHLAATRREAAGQVVVVAGEKAVTTRELVEAFCTAFELPHPSVRIPFAMGELMAACTEGLCSLIGREPPFSRRTLEFFNTNNVFDTSRARAVLGFVPRYGLAAGLAATREQLNPTALSAHSNLWEKQRVSS